MSFQVYSNKTQRSGDTTIKFSNNGKTGYISTMLSKAMNLDVHDFIAIAKDTETQALYVAKVPEHLTEKIDIFTVNGTTGRAHTIACTQLLKQTNGEIMGQKFRVLGGDHRLKKLKLTWYLMEPYHAYHKTTLEEIEEEFKTL